MEQQSKPPPQPTAADNDGRSHHPWDEVSLPGAGSSATEQPTILQVINKVAGADVKSEAAQLADTIESNLSTATQQLVDEISSIHKQQQQQQEQEQEQQQEEQPVKESYSTNVSSESPCAEDAHLITDPIAGDNLVKSSDNKKQLNDSTKLSSDNEIPTGSTIQPPATNQKRKGSDNVFELESHLIETFDEYPVKEDSVGISELQPVKYELRQGTSKIETDTNVRSVIEVEPVGAKLRQPVKTQFQPIDPQSAIEVANDAVNTATATADATDTDAATETNVQFAPVGEISEEIRATVEQLVDEIEREALETVQTNYQNQHEAQFESNATATKEETAPLKPSAVPLTADDKTEQPAELNEEDTSLSQKVDEQISEVTSILKASKPTSGLPSVNDTNAIPANAVKLSDELKIVDVPEPNSPLEAAERKRFIDSLPQIDNESKQLAAECKREYYQSLKKYLIQSNIDKPKVPLQTYRWEDLKRAKERGGYPWTHLYKRPLGPDEEPEIVLLLRKSQELRFTSESPRSLKKVRIDEQILVKETERYIQELSEDEIDHQPSQNTDDEESHSLHSESISCVSDSVLAVNPPAKSRKTKNSLNKIRGILKRRRNGRLNEDAQSLPGTSINTSRQHSQEDISVAEHPSPGLTSNDDSPTHKNPRCFPIMKKLKSMAERQKKRLNIKRITLRKDEKIVLGDETKILKLKNSPKSTRGEIPHFIEKQDSDDVLEIVELDESPSRKRKDDGRDEADEGPVQPDEIIDIAGTSKVPEVEPQEISEHIETVERVSTVSAPPKKAPRLRREHVYEEIEQGDVAGAAGPLTEMLDATSVEALKQSLTKQDNVTMKDIETTNQAIPLDRMGSSEEEQIAAGTDKPTGAHLLAPISSIESTSSDDERNRPHLSPVAEESDAASNDGHVLKSVDENDEQMELKPSIKKEASPAPSDKKVTFSHVEDEAESHREDIELPEEVREAAANKNKWKNMSDHEYEPIGEPSAEEKPSITKEASPGPQQPTLKHESKLAMEIEALRNEMQEAEDMQKDLEERYFSSETTTPRTESRTDYEIHTSQVDSSALEELPLKPENRKKGFMASAQDRTRRMQAGFKNQAGKIKTKFRSPAKKPPSGSPKAKERKRFKAPEFSKIKMPEIKRPDMSKLKDFKRPEFTKFNKPDMSKFKLPEKFSTLKLRRSKSLKENDSIQDDDMSGITADSGATAEVQPAKKMFEFNFGTYPRAFRRKKKEPLQPELSFETGTGTEGPSIIPSTETQPSVESSSSPQGDRGPGPVRSRWADKFSDVSYNDSEGSRYRRYGSEQESFERESSLERRMKDDLDETGSEPHDLGILGGVSDNKQFAEFDEENRAIHEISNLRAGEFKRRPMVHQDSDLRSEDSKDAVGWTDKEVLKNKLLRKAELEAEASYLKYPSQDQLTQDAQSTASSGKKVVMEEIDDDEFFLRKRGISEDNIELRQYISKAIREGYDMPINSLERVGQTNEPIEYGDYDVPPPKPRRLHKSYRPEDVSQEFDMPRSDFGDDLSMSQNGSDYFGAPKRPMRKGRSRSKYSMDSHEAPMADDRIDHEQYFDDDEEYLRPPRNAYKDSDGVAMNDLNFTEKAQIEVHDAPQPKAPRRRKRQLRGLSLEKDSYMNGFSGRSVSNSYLQPTENVIVYRTEHEYHIPLATPENYTDGASAASRKSRSTSRYDEDDRTSRGADSLALDANQKVDIPAAADVDADADVHIGDSQDKFIIDMIENDGYAIVRKEHIPKPTPPARRKKFSRSPGERFSTMPNIRTKRGSPPPARPPPPRHYVPSVSTEEPDPDSELDAPICPPEPVPPRRKPPLHVDVSPQNYEDDYEEPGMPEPEVDRPESPRNLHSGAVINKMKFRPLPPPPRPPREKRQRGESKGSATDEQNENSFDDRDSGGEKIATSSTADSYDQNGDFDGDDGEARFAEIEVSTQTDPLPYDFVCEEFEITNDMKVIEPRRPVKTLEELMREEHEKSADQPPEQLMSEDEQLARGLQRFRDANQRSLSEKSRASSQADHSRSLSRPQTPSAVVIERRVSTPAPTSQHSEAMLEAALIVRPIDDLDLEEDALRREGLLTDSSQHSKSDVDIDKYLDEIEDVETKHALSELSSFEAKDEEEVERTMRDYEYSDEEIERYIRKYAEHGDDDEQEAELDEPDMVADESREAAPEPIDDAEAKAAIEAEQQELRDKIESKLFALHEAAISHLEDVHPHQATKDFLKHEADILDEEPVQPPQPPPRRKSTTAIEPAPAMAIVEQASATAKEIAPIESLVSSAQQPQPQLPSRLAELEVERLRVHALQAGQIMVSQLHGTQISSDELECKSGNLVVKNIELPPGFIEDIVERVRSTDRSQLLTAETQTSLQASSETLSTDRSAPAMQEFDHAAVQHMVPPPKPPRHRELESGFVRTSQPQHGLDHSADAAIDKLRNLDEETQTDTTNAMLPPIIYPTTEYLQSLGPLAFYNLPRTEAERDDSQETTHKRRHHHSHYRRRETSSSDAEADESITNATEQRAQHRRTRSGTQPPAEQQTVKEAGRQFISACSLSLVNIIDQLTAFVRGGVTKEEDGIDTRVRQVPTLVVLFIVITFGLLLFLLSGKQVHTHHWDFFNPPGNSGRQS